MRQAKFVAMIKKITRKTDAKGNQELQIDVRVSGDFVQDVELQILKNDLFDDVLQFDVTPNQIDLTKD